MYKYKTWDDENKRFGSSTNEIGSSWEEANKIAKTQVEEAQKRIDEEKARQDKIQSDNEARIKADENKPSVWDKSVDFVSRNASKLKNWWDDVSFRMNEKSLFNPGREQNYTVDEKGKLKVEYPRLEKYNQAKTEEEKAQIRSEAEKATAEKTPLIQWLNTETGKKITGTVASGTSNLPLKAWASLKAIGDDTFDEAYSSLLAERNDPTNPRWERILYGIQDSGVQSAVGTLLAIGTSILSRNPKVGQTVAMTYFAAISAESQRQEKGQVQNLGNIAIDTVGDTVISGVAEAALKSVLKEGGEATLKTLMKETGKGFLVEGTTEPAQSFLKYANDYKNAKTEAEKQAVVADLTDYVKNGGMVDEFLIGGISGGIITGTATGAGMVAGKGQGEVNPSLQPNKATVGGEEAPKTGPKVVGELNENFSDVRDKVAKLEKAIETSTDENSLTELVDLQDKLGDYQNAVKERPLYLSDSKQANPLAEVETVKYQDGKFAFRFSADVGPASVSGNFSNTELFNTRNEAVKAGANAIIDWANNESKGADPEVQAKLDNLTAKVQEIIDGKNPKPQEVKPAENVNPADYNDFESYFTEYAKTLSPEQQKILENKNTVSSREIRYQAYKFFNSAQAQTAPSFNVGDEVSINTLNGKETGKITSLSESGNAMTVKTKSGSYTVESKDVETTQTQKEKVAEAIKEKPKSIKEIAEETKILEPNIRRILGVGAKEGTFERVEKGVYILNKDGQDVAFVHTGDAIETLPKLAKDGLKADMIFLDIPYKTPAVTGGNRGVKFETISVDEFKTVMDAVSKIARDENTPLYYMYSKAPSGLKKMLQYNDVLIEKGFKPVAEGGLTKLQKDGLTVVRNMRGAEIPPEGIILLTKSGKFDEIDEKRKLDFKLIRPKGYQTEKPAELLSSLIKQGTKKGGTVLDPFAGSGVTGAEAVKAGRKAVLVEKNQKAVDEFIKPRLQEAIKTSENDLQKVYSENKEKVEKALYEVYAELDIAEAGQKHFVWDDNKVGGEPTVIGEKSKFPQWIPEEYRSKKLFDKVMGGLMNIDEVSFPDKNKSKQREFYNLLLDEVDSRAGIDTSKMRENIINNYNEIYAKETTQNAQEAQIKESVSGGAKGSQEGEIKGIPSDDLGMFLRENMQGFSKDLKKTREIYDAIKSKKLHKNYWQEELDALTGKNEINVDDIFANITDKKKSEKLLTTSQAKELIKRITSETNPNIQKVLTFELFKSITSEKLKNKELYQGGWFDGKNTVAMARDMSEEKFALTLKHEIRHAAFSLLGSEDQQKIVDWYKKLSKRELVNLFGNETTLNQYLEDHKGKDLDKRMADEAINRQIEMKGKSSQNKIFLAYKKMIEKIVLALNNLNSKIFEKTANRIKVQNIFDEVFSQQGGSRFARSKGYLAELEKNGFMRGRILDQETGFSSRGISFDINPEEKTDEKTAKEFSENYGYKPTFYARGEFADFEEKFGEGIGGMEHIKPLELPELVKMVRELTGEFPEVKRSFRGNRLGDAQTGTLRVRILASLFEENKLREAKAVLAHELGHVVDFLPDKAMKKGNILAHIATLSKYLKHTLPAEMGGGRFGKARDLKNELIALSEYWHPYDKEKASPGFIKYRESNSEIYADALSVLFNSPGLLQEKAPNFYNAFFEFLDNKPAVKQTFFNLQELLDGNREEVIKARQQDLREGFAKAEEIIKQKHEERKAGNKNFWARLRQQLDDQNYPILKRQRDFEANGLVMPEEKNPKFALDELPFVDNENYLLLDDMNKEVVQPIELAGMTMDDMGEYLVLNRIMNDRSDVANPYGFTPDSAREQLEYFKKSVGEENFKMLEEKMKTFHEKVFASVEEAVRVGSYNKQIFEETIKPNKDTYAAFRVVDYIEENMPATIKKQVGTFKEIGNPFTATIIKTLSLNRLNAYQRAKNTTIEMLAKENEAVKSKSITTDGKLRIFKPAKGKGTIQLLEDGKLQSYDVDPYIAERFDRDSIGDINRLVAAVDMFNNNVFKPLVTTYNMGFALAFNPIRDFKRNYKNIKNATVLKLLKAYATSLPQSFRYARKAQMDEFTRSLVENKSIMAPINDYNFDAREDEFGKMLERYGLIKVDEKTSKLPKVVRKVVIKNVLRILDGMRLASNTFEIVSKIAGAKVRIKAGETGKSLYANIRDYTGTPNWTRKGIHTRTTNAIFVFSNIMKEGLKSDYKVATSPETRAGFWWKTVKVDLLPKAMMFAASAGIIDALFGLGGGDDEDKDGPIKKFFSKISEYDKTNYIIIPLGTTSDGKAIYMRIPHDETARLISAAFWKMANFAKDKELSQLNDMFAIGAGQLPAVTPAIDILSNWTQFLSGRNPYDNFRGRNVIDDQTFKAGGWRSLKKMLQWTTNTMGVSSFATYDTSKDTTVETTLRLTPLFNRLIKVSDYGLQEQEYTKQKKSEKEAAKQKLQKKETIKDMVKEGSDTEDIVGAVVKELKLDPENSIEDYKKTNLIRTEVKKEQIRQRTGTKTEMLLKAKNNAAKVEMLKKFKLEMDDQEFYDYINDLYDNKVISANVYEQI